MSHASAAAPAFVTASSRINPEADLSNQADPVHELRLAVVLYGGVSLAIYIAGVTQELHRLVQATAAAESTGGRLRLANADLDPGLAAYRHLGRTLGRRPGDPDHGPVRTRFVVDCIAGTSAGGINGAFLAKALANGQSLDPLKQLWLNKGDLGRLLATDAEPTSLLNSQQMYTDLLEAFDRLDLNHPATPPNDGPEIDCWLTATDIHGRLDPLPLNEHVQETSHRHVFHFGCAPGESGEFSSAHNPLLAFASRCTSSFPVAFEPMELVDCGDALARQGLDDFAFRKLFRRWRSDETPKQDLHRPYGDGGYLDNKPFSYVVDRLGRKDADLPVTRRLLYIEPVPDVLHEPDANQRPDAILNARAALLELPRREGIRADLQEIQQRNRQIEATLQLTRGIEKDVARTADLDTQTQSTEEWRNQDLRAGMDRHGAAYGIYHRIKVQSVLDHTTNIAARLAGFSMQSAARDGLRHVIAAWRTRYFSEFQADRPADGHTENEFLLRYDMPYRHRRLAFVLRALHDLAHASDQRRHDLCEAARLTEWHDDPELRDAASQLRRRLAQLAQDLRSKERQLRSSLDNTLTTSLTPLTGSHDALTALAQLRGSSPAALTAQAQVIVDQHVAAIAAFMGGLDVAYTTCFKDHARAIEYALSTPLENDINSSATAEASMQSIVARGIQHLLRTFERFDTVLFPVQWGTPVGELTPVDVVRISPRDATSIIDEATDQQQRTKLAGTTLHNFGAFLDERWRRNDYLWGRLDACERLFTSALPEQPELAQDLIRQAQEHILSDELGGEGKAHVATLLAQDLIAAGVKPDQAPTYVRQQLQTTIGSSAVEALMLSLLSAPALRQHMQQHYQVDRVLAPKRTLDLAGRTASVAGRLCGTLGTTYPLLSGPAGWLLRLGKLVALAIRLALPGGLGQAALGHWLAMLYLIEVVLLIGGFLTMTPEASDVATRLLLGTAGIHGGLAIMRQVLWGKGRPSILRLGLWFGAGILFAVLTLVVLVGAQRLAHLLERIPHPFAAYATSSAEGNSANGN